MVKNFKAAWHSPRHWMTRRYALALSAVAMMATAIFVTFGLLIEEYKSTLSVVNVSGRQRMLSQRTALFVEQLTKTQNPVIHIEIKDQLRSSIDLMEQSHLALTGRSNSIMEPFQISRRTYDAYFEGEPSLEDRINAYLGVLKNILELETDALQSDNPLVIEVLSLAPAELLNELDRMVHLHEREGEENFLFLQKLEGTFLSVTLIVLLLEALFIFRPMVNRVNAQFNQIQTVTKALETANNNLETTVRNRTRELDEAHQEAVEANKAKSRFLAATGHDLKQPLEAMVMFTGLLHKKVDNEQAIRILEDMKSAQGSMRSLLDSILEISKLEAGVVIPKFQKFALNPFLEVLYREYSQKAELKGLEMIYVPADLEIYSDPLLLERIIRNYLSNAVRYTKAGKILLGCRLDKMMVRIEIHDTGPGIPENEISYIFNEFSQLTDPERDRSEGIGLGLAVVRRLSGLMQQEIDCKNHVGRGCVFSVKVPQIKKQLETS